MSEDRSHLARTSRSGVSANSYGDKKEGDAVDKVGEGEFADPQQQSPSLSVAAPPEQTGDVVDVLSDVTENLKERLRSQKGSPLYIVDNTAAAYMMSLCPYIQVVFGERILKSAADDQLREALYKTSLKPIQAQLLIGSDQILKALTPLTNPDLPTSSVLKRERQAAADTIAPDLLCVKLTGVKDDAGSSEAGNTPVEGLLYAKNVGDWVENWTDFRATLLEMKQLSLGGELLGEPGKELSGELRGDLFRGSGGFPGEQGGDLLEGPEGDLLRELGLDL
ncbi:hypothetical protein HDU98_002146 [Podochytrium sp. JEL0797]|nr:hypothetical protein HDU98_002146 [Podochytrium sp. JEL0797]